MKAPGKYEVNVKINHDKSGLKRAQEIADELGRSAEAINTAVGTLNTELKKASSLLRELAECKNSFTLDIQEPIYTKIT